MKLKELRTQIIDKLKSSESNSPETDASLILMHVLGINKTQLLLGDITISDEDVLKIQLMTDRCACGEPVQYIIGKCEFMSLSFTVAPGVLIPRCDTEILVEEVIKRLNPNSPLVVADLGCGSGCIGISLAHYIKNISVLSVDISDIALKIANKNADRNNVSDRIRFLKLDMTKQPLPHAVDCIVSNPPYIRSDVIETLASNVRDHEPLSALDGGSDGLVFYRKIAENSNLNPGGLLAFEIGYDQGKAVSDILVKNGYINVEIIKDLENRDRVVLGFSQNN